MKNEGNKCQKVEKVCYKLIFFDMGCYKKVIISVYRKNKIVTQNHSKVLKMNNLYK